MSFFKISRLLGVALLSLVAPLGSLAQATTSGEGAAIAEAANRYMASGRPLFIHADQLKELMANPAAAPVVISVCAPDDHAKLRIPGSINMPRGAFFKPEQQAKLPPREKMIVTYCYAGTGAIGPAMALNLMGYNAVHLQFGMMGWSLNDVGLGQATRFPATQQNYPVVKGPQGTAVTYARPVVVTGKATLAEVVVARGDAIEATDKYAAMTAMAVQGLLTDSDSSNDPFIVDVRAPADFVKGHIAEAINVPGVSLYLDGNLAKLPLGRRIVIVDYNGAEAVGYSYVLSMMGYNARGLMLGMMGWSTDDALLGVHKRFPHDQRDFAVIGTAAK